MPTCRKRLRHKHIQPHNSHPLFRFLLPSALPDVLIDFLFFLFFLLKKMIWGRGSGSTGKKGSLTGLYNSKTDDYEHYRKADKKRRSQHNSKRKGSGKLLYRSERQLQEQSWGTY
ncbi:hypothetical protein ACFP3I_11540 [Chryseobacterium arachidis]|uniref:hypothetical protein n=1 Tax=Chryseobacterium arachidis TaxID=1416778 RepID=UPI0036204F1D